MTTHTAPPDDGMATAMENLDRRANEQQREEAKRNGGNGSHRPMGDGWFWRLTTTKHGNPHPHVANIGIELQYDPAWQGRFYYDELQGQLMLEKPVPGGSGVSRWDGLPRPWQDTDTIAAVGYFNLGDYPTIGFDRVDMAIREFAWRECPVHPIRNYLNALKWDGQQRIGNWLELYCQAEPTSEAHQAYIRAVGLKWLVSAVARIYEPGCQADHALVLEGPQGIGKTSVFRILGDKWFSENLPGDLHSKDAANHVRGRWIVELSELSALSRSETETVKNYLSRTQERFRPAYGKHEVVYPRQCVFAGTTNQQVYLKDETGGRRFWPIKVNSIDLGALKGDRDQLWAEAVHFYRAGERWWLQHPGLITTATAEQAARRKEDPWQEKVTRYLDGKTIVKSVGEVLSNAIEMDTKMQRTSEQQRVTRIMTDLGWHRGTRQGSSRPWVYSTFNK
jgi:putative DNA primase/helicase